MKRLAGKVAVITGGATGIGEAISKLFAREGAQVVVNGYEDDPVDDVVRAIRGEGGEAAPYIGDVSLERHAKQLVETAVNAFGKIDILVNNAGVFPAMAEIQEYPYDAFEYLLKNNIRTAFTVTKLAMRELVRTKGVILSAGSEAGKIGLAENAAYAGTKGFMHAFTRSIAVEQAKYGVRANCVCPGPIDTAWTHHESSPMSRKSEKTMLNSTPLGRRGTPEEVANVYLFLASDEASYMTGALVSVDGGITISKGLVGKEAAGDVRTQPDDKLNLEHTMEGATGIERGVRGAKGSSFQTSKPHERD